MQRVRPRRLNDLSVSELRVGLRVWNYIGTTQGTITDVTPLSYRDATVRIEWDTRGPDPSHSVDMHRRLFLDLVE